MKAESRRSAYGFTSINEFALLINAVLGPGRSMILGLGQSGWSKRKLVGRVQRGSKYVSEFSSMRSEPNTIAGVLYLATYIGQVFE